MAVRENLFHELMIVIDQLLSEQGCPWDKEQTVVSLSHMLLEEACESIDAIRDPNQEHFADELGDTLLAVLFLAKAAEREKRFSWFSPLERAREKLIRRHPHIFGEKALLTSEEVIVQWEELKKKEASHKQRKGRFDGIPSSLPGLALMQKLLHIGKKHPTLEQRIEKNLSKACGSKEAEEALAGQIASLILKAEEQGIQAEQALRKYFTSCKASLEKEEEV